MNYRIPFVNPRLHYQQYKAEFDRAIESCLSNGDLIARQQLRDFEAHFASFVGTKYAVGVNSGYHALALSLLAAGIGPADEVITVAHTFVATISAIVHCGAKPVLVDVGGDYNIDIKSMESALSSSTKAIIPVHLNGRCCNMDAVCEFARRHNLVIIEDACQSLGARYRGKMAGSFGLTGCWSFYPFKILGCFGDGGAITTDDPKIARSATLLRFNGEDRDTGEYLFHGFTALLDNIQASVLDVKLKHFPKWLEHRRQVASRYRKGLEGIDGLRLPHFKGAEYEDAFQNYVIRTSQRNLLRERLKSAGIETLVSWPKPVWKHMALNLGSLHLPETESICNEVLSLPMSAETTLEDVDCVCAAIKDSI